MTGNDMAAFGPGAYAGFTGYVNYDGLEGFAENAAFTIARKKKNRLFSMIWESGAWNGTMLDAQWKDGTWLGGKFGGGVWENGTWHDGLMVLSTWHGGVFKGGRMSGCSWHGGSFEGGRFFHSTWYGGEWKAGEWFDSFYVYPSGQCTRGMNAEEWEDFRKTIQEN